MPFSTVPGERRAAAMAPEQPASPASAAATARAFAICLKFMVPRWFAAGAAAPGARPARRSLLRERELDLEGVVDLDGLPAQQRRRVPAVLERIDHGAVHAREALHHPAVAHLALRADHALDDHQALDLSLQRLRGVLRVGAGDLLRWSHGVVELDGAGPAARSADLPAHHAAHHSPDHAALDAAFHAFVLLDLRLRNVGRLLFHFRDLLRLDHRRRRDLRPDPLRPGRYLLEAGGWRR